MLESQKKYSLKVVTWLARKHGGVFQPPVVGPSFSASFVHLGFGVSYVGPSLDTSSDIVKIPSKPKP